jgi:site-specific DNA-methyltransferase (adenine-specific)
LHFIKDDNNFTFNAEDPQVRVPSARALVYADKRANPAGRLPDDTWILRPQDLQDGFQPTDDTWYFARVAGTFKERQGFHGCQMPEQLLGRIIRVSSNPGDVVLDPFAGSGTTLAVAKKLGRQWLGCELSAEYVRAAADRLSAIVEGDSLDGPADPIASAPSTANGRRLEAVEDSEVSDPNSPSKASPQATHRRTAEYDTASATATTLREAIRKAIVEAFYIAHDGYSIDWLLASPQLQSAYHDACRDAGLIGGPAEWNRELLRIRKTGGFPKRGPIKKVQVSDAELDPYAYAAEIAWRLAADKFGGPSLDEILCDSDKAAYFDRAARRFAPGYESRQYRWAALRLRKASRELVDDVKKYHFVFAKRDFTRFQSWRRTSANRYAEQSGVYLLRGEAKRPLYIGASIDLGRRLAQHAECRAIDEALDQFAVITGSELPGAEYQAAFKEDLVRRYQPAWNVNLVGMGGTLPS